MNTTALRAATATVGVAGLMTVGLMTGLGQAPAAHGPVPAVSVAQTAPTGWTTVTDPGTGVSAALPGPAERRTEPVLTTDDREASGVAYHALEPSGRVEVVLHVSPLPREERPGPEVTAERIGHYALADQVEIRPLPPDGPPGVDAVVRGWPRDGGSGTGTMHLRIIDTPAFEVMVESNGDSADEALVRQFFDQACEGLRIP